jgi:hypothetical protein
MADPPAPQPVDSIMTLERVFDGNSPKPRPGPPDCLWHKQGPNPRGKTGLVTMSYRGRMACCVETMRPIMEVFPEQGRDGRKRAAFVKPAPRPRLRYRPTEPCMVTLPAVLVKLVRGAGRHQLRVLDAHEHRIGAHQQEVDHHESVRVGTQRAHVTTVDSPLTRPVLDLKLACSLTSSLCSDFVDLFYML